MQVYHLIPEIGFEQHKNDIGCFCNPTIDCDDTSMIVVHKERFVSNILKSYEKRNRNNKFRK